MKKGWQPGNSCTTVHLASDGCHGVGDVYSGQKIQTSVERMIRIWKERKIFKHKFVTELISLLGIVNCV